MKNNNSDEDRYICTHPFSWLEIQYHGNLYFCCDDWLNTKIGSLSEESLASIWNNEKAVKIRKSILDGSFTYCNKALCPFLNTKTGPVMKISDVVSHEIREAMHNNKTTLDYFPKELNFTYDRSCNLACPTCRDSFIMAKGEDKEIVDRVTEKIIKEALPFAEKIILLGSGDPFASPSSRDIIRSIDPKKMDQLKHIHLFSNAQLWTEKNWAKIKNIHPLVKTAEISIDAATAETYAINRRGGNFDKLLDNLSFISTLPISVQINFVVQENNYREMPAFIEIGQKHGFDIYFSSIVNWGTFSDKEFRRRAVHLPEHPKHNKLKKLLQDRMFRQKDVSIGNLTGILTEKVSIKQRLIRTKNSFSKDYV